MLDLEVIGPVERLRLGRSLAGRGYYFTAAYRVGGIMIDSGCAHTVPELIALLDRGEPPRVLLNTHSHEDHIGGNAALQRRFGVRIVAHPTAVEVMAAPRELQPEQVYRRIFWGYPEPSTGVAVEGDTVETEGWTFQVIPTPGHDLDHLAFFEPRQGWVFSGDAYVGGRDRELRDVSDPWQIIASLRRLLALDGELLFTGSGTVYRRPREALEEKVAYLEELGGRILALRQTGLPPRSIRDRLFGRERAIAWVTSFDFTSLNLVRSFLRGSPLPAA